MKWFNQLRQDPIGTIADWQDMRWPWILMAAVCVLLVLVAHYMFQVWLYMAPCEQCVYIRFGFLVMAIGGLLCAINPKNLILKVLGYVFAFAGAIYGLKCSVKLAAIHHAIHSDDPTPIIRLIFRSHSGRRIGLSRRVTAGTTSRWYRMESSSRACSSGLSICITARIPGT